MGFSPLLALEFHANEVGAQLIDRKAGYLRDLSAPFLWHNFPFVDGLWRYKQLAADAGETTGSLNRLFADDDKRVIDRISETFSHSDDTKRAVQKGVNRHIRAGGRLNFFWRTRNQKLRFKSKMLFGAVSNKLSPYFKYAI